ncbi:hypothetical protein STAS_30917 [Striga asiatica]|uniref:Uncharacterized protein n=1 Tax=Striga asiatica TaxID=4170 RepID=A0A5A7RAK8_STRAF|nr:hypothetical protein STAS_30917 [Striga asiatica]
MMKSTVLSLIENPKSNWCEVMKPNLIPKIDMIYCAPISILDDFFEIGLQDKAAFDPNPVGEGHELFAGRTARPDRNHGQHDLLSLTWVLSSLTWVEMRCFASHEEKSV